MMNDFFEKLIKVETLKYIYILSILIIFLLLFIIFVINESYLAMMTFILGMMIIVFLKYILDKKTIGSIENEMFHEYKCDILLSILSNSGENTSDIIRKLPNIYFPLNIVILFYIFGYIINEFLNSDNCNQLSVRLGITIIIIILFILCILLSILYKYKCIKQDYSMFIYSLLLPLLLGINTSNISLKMIFNTTNTFKTIFDTKRRLCNI